MKRREDRESREVDCSRSRGVLESEENSLSFLIFRTDRRTEERRLHRERDRHIKSRQIEEDRERARLKIVYGQTKANRSRD